jgi:NAD(P)H-dependent flavin oxidoreductase YrpB (nitropropane dioxygenase family)
MLTALTQPSPDALRKEIQRCKSMTSKPFGVNITLLPSMTLKPSDYALFTQAIIDEGVTVVETAGNNPGPVIKQLKEAGIIVIHKCTNIRHALSAQKLGVDCLSIDGFEAAGHVGEQDVGTLVLLAKAKKVLSIPFIASGGMADGRSVAAALALGSVGANMGTRMMCTAESPIHHDIKLQIVKGTENDTALMLRSFKNTARIFKNKIAIEVSEIEKRSGAEFKDVAALVSGARGKTVYEAGESDAGVWSAGQSMALIDSVPTCAELLSTIEKEVEGIIGGLNQLVVPSNAARL